MYNIHIVWTSAVPVHSEGEGGEGGEDGEVEGEQEGGQDLAVAHVLEVDNYTLTISVKPPHICSPNKLPTWS